MKIRVLGSSGSKMPGHHGSSLLVNQGLLLDAGSVVSVLALDEQAAIDDVLLTHAHLDHIVDLAFLVDNVHGLRTAPLRVRGPHQVLDAVHRHLFNGEVWPDFTRLPSLQAPALQLIPLPPSGETDVQGLRVRWVQTRHPVFSAGYCLAQEDVAVLFSGDTGPTEDLWRLGREFPGLKGAFIETSFPRRLTELATAWGHLTPETLKLELRKLDRAQLPVKILHMKPQFLDEITGELNDLGEDRLQILNGGEEFSF